MHGGCCSRRCLFAALAGREASCQPRRPDRSVIFGWRHQLGHKKMRARLFGSATVPFWVGLLNGIKPEGADRVIGAFVNGRVRYESDFLKEQTSSIDFAQPTWLGISGGQNWISFASPAPSRHIIFQLKENEVTVLDVITFYE